VKISPDFQSLPSQAVLVEALRQRGARRYSHSGRSLLDHLLGTWTILREWGQALPMCLAGLFHSCYSTDAYPNPLFKLNERSVVRALIGPAPEELVYAFCTVDRKELVRSVLAAGEIPEAGLPGILFRSGQSQQLQRPHAAELLLLEMANLTEQMMREGGAPGVGLARVSALGVVVRPFIDVVPRVFDQLRASLEDRSEQMARTDYLKALECLAADPNGAQAALDQAAAANPWVGEISLLMALLALQRQEWEVAHSKAQAGTRLLRQWGTAWDKRHSWLDWLRLGEWLTRLSAKASSQPSRHVRLLSLRWPELVQDPFSFIGTGLRARQSESRNGMVAGRASSSNKPRGWSRFELFLGRFLTNGNSPGMTWYPGLTAKPWHDPSALPAVLALEAAYPAIHEEYERLKGGTGFQPEMEPLARTGHWDVFMLYERGRKNEENCAKCPETVRVIESIETVRTLSGLVYFSEIRPGTHILPHKGPTNLRVRCHLGIHVPAGCAIRVGKETRTWEVGKCLVFDDSFAHEIRNDGDRTRAVLIVDLWHPDLSPIEIQALEGLQRYAHFHAGRLQDYWSSNQEGRASMEMQERWL
jgi:hypothetical protein